MKKYALYKTIALSLVLATTSVPHLAAKTNFNVVGKQMIIMLRNSHYERLDFDASLGTRFFDTYIKSLDGNKQYFLASDITMFRNKYGENLHELLMQEECMTPAVEIYDVYRKRANERIKHAQELLKADSDFSFDSDREVILDREKAEWPKSQEEAKQIWKDQVEQALLSEVLRRESVADLAAKQGKDDPLKDKKLPGEMIS
jgi:carboxyl-terminal processing protease